MYFQSLNINNKVNNAINIINIIVNKIEKIILVDFLQ